jgi:cytochrome P450
VAGIAGNEWDALAVAYARLPERQRFALDSRLGPHAERPLTLRETGRLLGVGPERARQLANAAYAELARALARAAAGQGADWVLYAPDYRAAEQRLRVAIDELLEDPRPAPASDA